MRFVDHLFRGVVWMYVCCDCFVLTFRGLDEDLVTFTKESYGCLSVVSVVCCQVEVCATS